ncbi:protein enabled homolog [Helianthus annuus]|uniref:protein enabled homolog n=1 Tax=Helianthus annuus TaxID=4232 RepID=UPI000B8EF991|nr:protein enabled homolog [Helianthus annuus]
MGDFMEMTALLDLIWLSHANHAQTFESAGCLFFGSDFIKKGFLDPLQSSPPPLIFQNTTNPSSSQPTPHLPSATTTSLSPPPPRVDPTSPPSPPIEPPTTTCCVHPTQQPPPIEPLAAVVLCHLQISPFHDW